MTLPRLACGCAAFALLAAGVASGAATSAVDPDALAALNKMGAELRTHQNFDVTSDVTTEDVLGDGQKLQYSGTVEVQARRPNGFRISMVSDRRDRQLYYDGKSLTVYSPRLGYYASFPAPDTIAKTLERAKDQYGIELPLADLFAWGVDKSLEGRVLAGFKVASEHVGDRKCSHYALRQKSVDWQVWIADDGPALPCKLVITSTEDPAMPQYSSVLHWSFPASIPDSTFAFAAPPSSKKIVVAKVDTGGKAP
jgi:hypothetical protein